MRKFSGFLPGLILGGILLAGCFLFNDPYEETPPIKNSRAKFDSLRYDSRWYRTFDSTSNVDIVDTAGSTLFAWTFGDSTLHPDSFYVGVDTLWALPQDVSDSTAVAIDTANDWDLQICPDGFCMGGIKADSLFGINAPFHFGDTLASGKKSFETEHHFQFYGAIDFRCVIDIRYCRFTAPDSSLFGALLYVRSRSSGRADTIFGFGAWQLEWDSNFIPPVRPKAGYRPKRSDFVIVGNKARYVGP